MHSSITPARIPPLMTIVPADIRPALHQTLQRSDAERDKGNRKTGEDGEEKRLKLVGIDRGRRLRRMCMSSLHNYNGDDRAVKGAETSCRILSILMSKKGFYNDQGGISIFMYHRDVTATDETCCN